MHASPLSTNAAHEAIRLRTEYQRHWQEQQANRQRSATASSDNSVTLTATSASACDPSSELIDADAVAQFWSERCAAFIEAHGAAAAAELDFAIQFLPPTRIQELLASATDATAEASTATRPSFLAVNSICFFADGASLH